MNFINLHSKPHLRSVTKSDSLGRIISINQYKGKNLVVSIKCKYDDTNDIKVLSYYQYCKLIQ